MQRLSVGVIILSWINQLLFRMKKTAHQIAKKYNIDYQLLIGRGKSHQVQAARRELCYELLTNDFDVHEIAKLLNNRSINIIRRLQESYKVRDSNKRDRPGPKIDLAE